MLKTTFPEITNRLSGKVGIGFTANKYRNTPVFELGLNYVLFRKVY